MEPSICARWLAKPNCGHSHFLVVFRAHMNTFIIVKVKILVDIKWSYMSPELSWPLSLEWFNIYWACSPISLNMSFWCPILVPHLNRTPSNIAFCLKKRDHEGPRTLETQQCTWILQYSCLQKQLTCEYKKVMDQSYSCYITQNVKFLVSIEDEIDCGSLHSRTFLYNAQTHVMCLTIFLATKGISFRPSCWIKHCSTCHTLVLTLLIKAMLGQIWPIAGQVTLSRLKRSYWAPTFSHLMCRCADVHWYSILSHSNCTQQCLPTPEIIPWRNLFWQNAFKECSIRLIKSRN